MIKTTLADKLVKTAVRQLENGVKFRQPRLDTITQIEDLYLNKAKKALKARFSVCLPIMGAFIDTLLSNIDQPPVIKFGHKEEADRKKTKKVTAAWESDSQDPTNDWAIEDLDAKKFAAFSGVGIMKYHAESDPKYSSHLEANDYNDFVCEPKGGADLEKHFYLGQENIFKTWADLKKGAKKETYDDSQIRKLKRATTDEGYKRNDTLYQTRKNRYQALGLNPEDEEYIGEAMYRLTEWGMVYNGIRYYLLFDYETGIWVRCEKLKDVYASDLWPWVAWHTHRDKRVFWTKGPADDMIPVCENSNTIFNQALENRQNANFGQRAYDAKMFPDPSELEWRPGGLVRAKASQMMKRISDGVYEFKTSELSIRGTIDMISFMDSFWGQKTGVSPSKQGVAERQKKVGIFFGELQEIAKKFGLLNKYFKRCWVQLGLRWLHGIKEHLTEKFMVKIIGEKGEGWEEMVNDDLDWKVDPDIIITGGSADAEADVIKKQNQQIAINDIAANPVLAGHVNPRWVVEQKLSRAGYEEADIKRGMDVENFGYEETITEAAIENQKLMEGKEVRPNRKAVIAHIQRHMDLADTVDNEIRDMEEDERSKDKIAEKEKVHKLIYSHIEDEMPYVVENMKRDALMKRITGGTRSPLAEKETPGAPVVPEERPPAPSPSAKSVPAMEL
jgi:hypothetical protein